MQIDAKTALWLNIIYSVLTGLTAPMLQATGVADASHVLAWAALIAMPLNVILHAYSSSTPGPLAPPDAPAIKAAQTAIDNPTAGNKQLATAAIQAVPVKVAIAFLAVLLVASFAFNGRAYAAPLKLHPRGCWPASACNVTPHPAPVSPITSIQAFTLADLQAALADANAQSPPDTRHGACWSALIPIVQANIPNPFPAGLGLAQLVQKTFDDQTLLFGHQAWKDTIAQACALTVLDLNSNLATLLSAAGLGAIVVPKLPPPF